MAPVLYPQERRLLEYLSDFITRNGYSPTLREIAEALNLSSPATIHEHFRNLEKYGYLKRKKIGQRLSIEILKPESDKISISYNLPILGYIAAGKPLEPYTDPNAYLSLPSSLVQDPQNTFILQVKGDSMVEDGILDGDYVVIKYQETAENGDIIVALLDNGVVTLKKFYREKDKIKLQPANSKMEPIYTTNIKIQGKVIGVLRKYRD